ncbi:MAG: dihydropteroate synthase [Rickettsiales bacterium]|nr:dihydropteroate synthase [Rickettsiales bacterium]
MTKIVAILNVTPDSFSDGGKFNSLESAVAQVAKMIEEGADVIDIGAESTRPQATPIGPQEEWRRLEKVLPAVIAEVKKSPKKIKTSIDSYHFETLVKAWEMGVDVVNDVTGLSDERIVNFIAEKNVETVLMHNAAVPAVEGCVVNRNINLIGEMLAWGERKIAELEKKNVKKSQLIFDVGIGFGKDALQSIRVLKNIGEFRKLDLPLYVGHSKKSFLDEVKIAGDRAEKTLVVSKYLIKKNVDFLRIHDVAAHKKILVNN